MTPAEAAQAVQRMVRSNGLVNQAALRAYLLERLAAKRAHKFTRISSEAISHYVASVEAMLKQWARHLQCSCDAKDLPDTSPRLLYWKKVQRVGLGLARGHWGRVMEIKRLTDAMPMFLEIQLRHQIDRDIHRVPSVGRTYIP